MSSATDLKEHLGDCVKFLVDYEWIFSSANTRFINDNTFLHADPLWIQLFAGRISTAEYSKIPGGYINECWPVSFKTFLCELNTLKEIKWRRDAVVSSFAKSFRPSHSYGHTPKKMHEIVCLGMKLKDICRTEANLVIDIGSGLGYLPEHLSREYQFNVLGLESTKSRVQTAQSRQFKIFPTSIERVMYKEHFLNEKSDEFISAELMSKYGTPAYPFAISGLHTCGDLTSTAIDLFFRMPSCENMVVMPCCYHKLTLADLEGDPTGQRVFNKFPLSHTLKNIFDNLNCYSVFNRPFLRLACQETITRWEQMDENDFDHIKYNLFSRAFLEYFLAQNPRYTNVKSTIKRRKQIYDLQYIALDDFERGGEDWVAEDYKLFNELLEPFSNGLQLAGALITLQTAIQEICERIVLLDFVMYSCEMTDLADETICVYIEKIFDDSISPRCNALVLERSIAQGELEVTYRDRGDAKPRKFQVIL